MGLYSTAESPCRHSHCHTVTSVQRPGSAAVRVAAIVGVSYSLPSAYACSWSSSTSDGSSARRTGGEIGVRCESGKFRDIGLPKWVSLSILCWLVATGIVQRAIVRSLSRHEKLSARHIWSV